MADYISREAAIKEFCDDCMDREWCNSNGETCSRIKNINAVPAADVRPVVRGKWEDINLGWAQCTNCKLFVIGSREKSQYRFCPNCGADMREVKADG